MSVRDGQAGRAVSRIPWALLAFVVALPCGCQTGPTAARGERTKIDISAPEWLIEEQVMAYTPIGSNADNVLDFVRGGLHHSGSGVSFENLNVGPVRVENAFTDDIVFKMIQVHMGIHGRSTRTLVRTGNWVYLTWIFDANDDLIDIFVSKVRPVEMLKSQDGGMLEAPTDTGSEAPDSPGLIDMPTIEIDSSLPPLDDASGGSMPDGI